MCVGKIYSDGSIVVYNNSDETTTIGVDPYYIANKINEATANSEFKIKNSFEDLSYQIKLIEEEYENQLQRQKVHISRGDEIKGNRIHCRRRKITIPKRFS